MTDTTPTHDSPAAEHTARASLYAACAATFQFPDEDVVADLTDEGAVAGLRAAADRLGFTEEVTTLLEAVKSADREDLEGEYQRLFGIPGDDGTYPVVPYEATYTAGEEIGKQQRRIATVVGLMETFGLEPSDSFSERQDHVAAELELLQVVAAQRAVAVEEEADDVRERLRAAETTLLAAHLGDFVPSLAERIRAETDSDVYRAAADLAEALVTWDLARHPDEAVTPTDLDGPAGVSEDA
ncbi:MAG: molecular chaperone [Halorhabdus sp.]